MALRAGLADNKVCAIDGAWSGLRPVVRKGAALTRSANTQPKRMAGRSPTCRNPFEAIKSVSCYPQALRLGP